MATPFAERSPGEAPVGGLTPTALMQIITGFWAAKTLAATVELDLFTKISDKGADVTEQ